MCTYVRVSVYIRIDYMCVCIYILYMCYIYMFSSNRIYIFYQNIHYIYIYENIYFIPFLPTFFLVKNL